ncbi:collagen-like protein [Aquimarina sp. ERC-38]|uniref:collagen-like protein n=1 Tax=Aquimarina sp. ERC-38 TaxID=2949996 RepID=UPI002245BFF7|nr:collagen-like protein [Aquimarina sp. ERC-38]UZO79813.1 collagen-like protein [Aquimarina sp. ERC-38]
MRKLMQLLFISLLVIGNWSCEGPEGLPGRDGFDGRDGQNGRDGQDGQDGRDGDTLTQIYEIESVNFDEANNFGINFAFPQAVPETDIVFVYRLEDVIDGKAVWEPLPTATIYFDDNNDGIDDGFLQYRYNFTFDDVDILIESDDPIALGEEFTNDQVFRIAVVPAVFGSTKNTKTTSLEELMKLYSIAEKDIIKKALY